MQGTRFQGVEIPCEIFPQNFKWQCDRTLQIDNRNKHNRVIVSLHDEGI